MSEYIGFTVAENMKKITTFLNEVGINVHYKQIDYKTFLPGISIENGAIVIDKEKLKYPGDILHEAGHIAVVPTIDRLSLNEHNIATRTMREAEEMMAIAWSYAVCVHLQIDPSFVFHDNGYKGGGSDIAENFKAGRYFGVPMLQWTGMALEKDSIENAGLPIYPKMLHWLRT